MEKSEFDEFVDSQERFAYEANELHKRIYRIRGKDIYPPNMAFGHIDLSAPFPQPTLVFVGTIHHSGPGAEDQPVEDFIPAHYLWDESWVEVERAKAVRAIRDEAERISAGATAQKKAEIQELKMLIAKHGLPPELQDMVRVGCPHCERPACECRK